MPETDKQKDDICPNCGGEIEYDEVDIGVGVMRGNPACRDCGWTPKLIEPRTAAGSLD